MGGHGSTRWNVYDRRACIGETTRALKVSALRAPLLRLAYLPLRRSPANVEVDITIDWNTFLRGQLVGDVQGVAPLRASFYGWITTGELRNLSCHTRHALSVPLIPRRQPRGGFAWLMMCPLCGRKCRTIYMLPRTDWGCRMCLQLGYRVQRLMPARRLEFRAAKLRTAVGGSWLDEEFPNQPAKGRWRSRFERLRAAHDDAMDIADLFRLAPLVRWNDRLFNRIRSR